MEAGAPHRGQLSGCVPFLRESSRQFGVAHERIRLPSMNRGKAARAIQERSTARPPADHANVGSGRSAYKAASTGRGGAPFGDSGTVGGRSGDRYVLSSGKPCFSVWRSWGTNSVASWEHSGRLALRQLRRLRSRLAAWRWHCSGPTSNGLRCSSVFGKLVEHPTS